MLNIAYAVAKVAETEEAAWLALLAPGDIVVVHTPRGDYMAHVIDLYKTAIALVISRPHVDWRLQVFRDTGSDPKQKIFIKPSGVGRDYPAP